MKKDNMIKQAARWVAKTFGYKSETLFGKIVWRGFALGSSIVVLFFASVLVYHVIDEIGDKISDRKQRKLINSPTYLHEYGNRYVSPYVIYHDGYPCYLYNTIKGTRTITGITWICKSTDGDSLAFFSDGENRGFFNRFTGDLVIPAQYEKAWVFSEDVACVLKDGMIVVIDHKGNMVIDKKFPYSEGVGSYCFHNGLCPMSDGRGRIGLINKKGEWFLEPEYTYMNYHDSGFWMAYDKDGNEGLFDREGKIFLPFEFSYLRFDYDGDYIHARRNNHVDQVYDLEGNLVNSCDFDKILTMDYETDECVFSDYYESYQRKPAAAHLSKYRTSDYHYGLIDKAGNIITLPAYNQIVAIAADRYLCEGDEGTVILDDKGQECGKKL